MKAKAAFLLIGGMIGLVAGWTIRPVAMAQTPPNVPSVPTPPTVTQPPANPPAANPSTPPANPPKPASEQAPVADLSKLRADRLAALEFELSQKTQPKLNAMPGTQNNGFVQNQELLLRLVKEVQILRERVDKLEKQVAPK